MDVIVRFCYICINISWFVLIVQILINKFRHNWYNYYIVGFFRKEEVEILYYIASFIITVVANVVSNCISKWLDKLNKHDN